MATFTQADLVGHIRQAAGEDGLDLEGDIAEVTFADLGYDSVAMLEITLSVERALGISLPDDQYSTGKAATPKRFVELVNELLPASI